MRGTARIVVIVLAGVISAACNRSTSATADSAAPAAGVDTSFDEGTARAQILAADSAFVRAIIAKHVDSLMLYYDPDVVSLGTRAVKGTSDVRRSYTEAVKNPPREVNFESGGVNFSRDHSMAWDYGTVSETVDVNGKPVKRSGTYLNVWKNVGGRWMIVAEISNTGS